MSDEIDANLHQYHGDEVWLNDHIEGLFTSFSEALNKPDCPTETIDQFLLLLPCLLTREDLKRWGKLLIQSAKHLPMKITYQEGDWVTYDTGELYVLNRKKRKPRPTKRRRSRERLETPEMLASYILLLASRLNKEEDPIGREHMSSALAFARHINDPFMYGKLYQLLALVHTRLGETERAKSYALLAHDYWLTLHEWRPEIMIEQAISAYTLGTVYKAQGNLEHAIDWLNTAIDLLSNPPRFVRQRSIFQLERAALRIDLQQHEDALQELSDILDEFEEAPYYRALTHHHIGAAQIYLDQTEDAIANLNAAIALWGEHGYPKHCLQSECLLALAEARTGQMEQQARDHLQHILNQETNADVRATAQQVLDALDENRVGEVFVH